MYDNVRRDHRYEKDTLSNTHRFRNVQSVICMQRRLLVNEKVSEIEVTLEILCEK